MKSLKAFCLHDIDVNDVEKLHAVLDKQKRHRLEFHLWKNGNDDKPEVSFSIGHNNRSVLLKFYVEEKEIRANVVDINGPVWEDSCVEFFVSFDETGYYNFEFNCIGTVLAAFRQNRDERTLIPEVVLKRIETYTKLIKKNAFFNWEMLIVIPVELFNHHSMRSLSGISCTANFYKCGDGLSHPFYLSWSDIKADKPNFHLPQFFGEVKFE